MSHDRSRIIRRFIVRHIQDQDLSENNGVPGKALQQLCLQEFCGDLQDPQAIKTEKDSIVEVIRGMVQDNMLQPVKSNDNVVFRLDPYFNVKDPMNPNASQPSEDPQGTQEALEALEKETSPDVNDVYSPKEDQLGESADGQTDEQAEEQLQIEKQLVEQHVSYHKGRVGLTEATRHAEAYAEITRGAAPLPIQHPEEHIETPSRKRPRVMEIAASDSSSSMDPISPGKYANSTPQRRRVRMGTPLSDSRRLSAPGILLSPAKNRSPGHIQQRPFKEERIDTSPLWLLNATNALRLKYPDDPIKTDNGHVVCLTCNKGMKPTNAGLSTIEQHLKGKPHREMVELARRIDKAREYSGGFPATIPSMDFNVPQAPLAVFAHPGQPQLAALRDQYFAALENDAHVKSIQSTQLQSRVAELQKITTAKLDGFESSLRAFERQDTERQGLISDIIATSEEKHKELTREVVSRVKTFETKNAEQLKKMADHIAATGEESNSRIDKMTTLLARSDQRNIVNIETMTERIDTWEKRNDELAEKIQKFDQVIDERDEFKNDCERLAMKIAVLERSNDEKDASMQRLWDSVLPVIEKTNVQEQINESQSETNESLHILEGRISQLDAKIKCLEKINEGQKETSDTIHDLESQYQLLTEALQLRTEGDEKFQKAISGQMEAHFVQTEKRMALVKEECSDSILKTVASGIDEIARLKEELLMVKQQAAEREKQLSARIRSLKKNDEVTKDHIKRFNVVMPTLLNDFTALEKFVQEHIERRSIPRQSVSQKKARSSAWR